ncbi:hypothetical protein BC940DRAFT_64974 [Gongronella butleri]|nr:hypothetical protein BC940DRAFT_64974 [Gongronella butleri]
MVAAPLFLFIVSSLSGTSPPLSPFFRILIVHSLSFSHSTWLRFQADIIHEPCLAIFLHPLSFETRVPRRKSSHGKLGNEPMHREI